MLRSGAARRFHQSDRCCVSASRWRLGGGGRLDQRADDGKIRKLAVEAADNGLMAPEIASDIPRVKGVASKGVRLGNWLSAKQAQKLLNTPDVSTAKGVRDRAILVRQ